MAATWIAVNHSKRQIFTGAGCEGGGKLFEWRNGVAAYGMVWLLAGDGWSAGGDLRGTWAHDDVQLMTESGKDQQEAIAGYLDITCQLASEIQASELLCPPLARRVADYVTENMREILHDFMDANRLTLIVETNKNGLLHMATKYYAYPLPYSAPVCVLDEGDVRAIAAAQPGKQEAMVQAIIDKQTRGQKR